MKGYLTFSAVAFWIGLLTIQWSAQVTMESSGFGQTSPGFQDFYLAFTVVFCAAMFIEAVGFTIVALVSWGRAGYRALRAT